MNVQAPQDLSPQLLTGADDGRSVLGDVEDGVLLDVKALDLDGRAAAHLQADQLIALALAKIDDCGTPGSDGAAGDGQFGFAKHAGAANAGDGQRMLVADADESGAAQH